MSIKLNPMKATQAAGVLLSAHAGRQMDFLRLLKLLYIADRESLKKTGLPIIGDNTVAMKNGPRHEEVYELIKGTHKNQACWSQFIVKQGSEIRLMGDPGCFKLSDQDIAILREVAGQHCEKSESDIMDFTHTFAEWNKNVVPGVDSTPIPIEDILDGIGFSGDDKALILADLKEIELDDSALLVSASVST